MHIALGGWICPYAAGVNLADDAEGVSFDLAFVNLHAGLLARISAFFVPAWRFPDRIKSNGSVAYQSLVCCIYKQLPCGETGRLKIK